MKVGVFLALFGDRTLEQALDYVTKMGIDTVEIGTGNWPGDPHCKPGALLRDGKKLQAFQDTLKKYGVTVSALSCHGNALHPNEEIAKKNHRVQRNTILLCQKLGIERMITFSGCPGGGPGDKTPNWATCAWPPDFLEVLKYQWEEKAIPYWREEAKFAANHGVKICFEAHPGFLVYNPETLLRLRAECGDNIGANFDPSHFFWQGIDPIAAAREMGPAIFHVHAKDTKINPYKTIINGALDTKHYGDVINRSWVFRTVGYGHGEDWWRDFVSTLRAVGYDDVLSIEHEDSLMSQAEGLTKAVQFLQGLVIKESAGAMWWA
ncbi:MAG: sugar phosphate isomerase/epimerase [Candidatus Sumerlaeota bacterium]|nr:sugar phosphate isomerase/epimerase [Candidatus Sumerlaeota bacterium]